MIRIIAVGRMKEEWMSAGVQEYLKRIRPYEKIEVVEVPDEKAPEKNSEAQNRQVMQIEGEKVLKRIKDQEYVILLDLKGKEYSSMQMAEKIDQLHTYNTSVIDFVIGGSLGVSDALIKRADMRWKLSECTFPHPLCRLILSEQIYRCMKILNHEPYHK